mgnify:CR=1 FL=1
MFLFQKLTLEETPMTMVHHFNLSGCAKLLAADNAVGPKHFSIDGDAGLVFYENGSPAQHEHAEPANCARLIRYDSI